MCVSPNPSCHTLVYFPHSCYQHPDLLTVVEGSNECLTVANRVANIYQSHHLWLSLQGLIYSVVVLQTACKCTKEFLGNDCFCITMHMSICMQYNYSSHIRKDWTPVDQWTLQVTPLFQNTHISLICLGRLIRAKAGNTIRCGLFVTCRNGESLGTKSRMSDIGQKGQQKGFDCTWAQWGSVEQRYQKVTYHAGSNIHTEQALKCLIG